jgi:drug/metabolite transporter (DMT)-like permease
MPGQKSFRPLSPRAALFLGILAVSSGSIFVRFAQADAPSMAIAAYRMVLAAIVLLPFAWLRYRREWSVLKGRDWFWISGAGILLAAHFATWITSLEYTSVASSVVLVSTSPLWVALIAWIAWREPVSPSVAGGLALALGGSVLISFAEARSAISPRPLLGNVLATAGALTVSGYWLIGRRMRRSLSLIPYVTLVYGFAALVLLAIALLSGQALSGFKSTTYGWFLLLALLPQLLGHSSFNWALGQLPATYIAVATLGEPLGAAILAMILLGEIPSLLKVLAAALILSGILMALRRPPREAQSASPRPAGPEQRAS